MTQLIDPFNPTENLAARAQPKMGDVVKVRKNAGQTPHYDILGWTTDMDDIRDCGVMGEIIESTHWAHKKMRIARVKFKTGSEFTFAVEDLEIVSTN